MMNSEYMTDVERDEVNLLNLLPGDIVYYHRRRFYVTNIQYNQQPIEISYLGGRRSYVAGMREVVVTIREVREGLHVEPMEITLNGVHELMTEEYAKTRDWYVRPEISHDEWMQRVGRSLRYESEHTIKLKKKPEPEFSAEDFEI